MRILTYPDKRLRVKADPVEDIDDDILTLADMLCTLMKEKDALGLAATQLGVSKRLFVYDAQGIPKVIINPEIISKGDNNVADMEGCLSVVGYAEKVTRPHWIKVKGLSIDGVETAFDAYGMLARIIQHENDHLDGILFIDRISRLKQGIYKRKLKKLMNRG